MKQIEYKCDFCNSVNVKLWREYGVFETKLYCLKCLEKIQKKIRINRSYIIDWFVPAIISKNGFEFDSIHNYDLSNWIKLEPKLT